MHIRLSLSTLIALAAAVVWSADPAAHVPTTGRIEGTVTLVSPGGAPVQSGAYPSRRVTRPAPPPSELANVVVSIKDPPPGGLVPLTHSDMSATIVVFDHPFYTAPSADGTFALDDVPAGQYQLAAWHERIGENSTPVEVTLGGTAHARFILPIDVH